MILDVLVFKFLISFPLLPPFLKKRGLPQVDHVYLGGFLPAFVLFFCAGYPRPIHAHRRC